jgi:hypothetical protein
VRPIVIFNSPEECRRDHWFYPLPKDIASMQMTACGIPVDDIDEYLRIGKDTTHDYVPRFAKVIIRLFGP